MDYERLNEIFEQYGSMTLSYGVIEEQTFESFFLGNVFEGTGCTLGELYDKTLERLGNIIDAFITHAGVDENDSQKLALMAVLYEMLWDDVCGCWNDDTDIIRIEYNDEVLVNKPTNEVFEEYKSYLEKVEGHVPRYECYGEDWDDENSRTMDYERLNEIFEQYGSMTLSWGDVIEEQTFKKFFESNAFEGTNCTFGEMHDKALERVGNIVDAFITHAGVDENDSQKLALMAVLYEILWDEVCDCWNDDTDIIRIEYNDEVLVNKPTIEVFEEYKSYLEKVEGHVPPYEDPIEL